MIKSSHNSNLKRCLPTSEWNCRAIFVKENLDLKFANLFYFAILQCFNHYLGTHSSQADLGRSSNFNWLDSYLLN